VPLFSADSAEARQTAFGLLQEFMVASGEQLRRYLLRRTVNQQEAEDIVQEAYCRLLEHPNPRQIHQPRSFVFRMAVNLLIDQRRREQRGKGLDGPIDSAFGQLDFNELSTAYQRELKRLPVVCQHVFVLCRHEGLSSAEISVRLGISQRMVQKHLVKALRHFQQHLR
jgi:RNA polymerase sigma-70 factor (ECF subfamily)